MQENKAIRDKINSIEGLPETYQPNMASKWSLLEAGLESKNKRKVFLWRYTAVAAGLALLLVGSLMFFNRNETLQLSEKAPVIIEKVAESTPTVTMKKKQVVQVQKVEFQLEKKRSVKKVTLAEEKLVEIEETEMAVVPIKDSIVQPIVSENEISLEVADVTERKKPRFIEFDFNDNVQIKKPIEPITASNQSKNKIELAWDSEDRGGITISF